MPRPSLMVLGLAAVLAAPLAGAQVTLYTQENFRGGSYQVNWDTPNLDPYGFNDRTASLIVEKGRWQFCADAFFQGGCTVLGPGQYPSLSSMGLTNAITSIRHAGKAQNASHPPAPPPNYDYYPRYDEPVFQADVTAVRAVYGPPEQRCWTEQRPNTDRQVGGAILGGILGGVLGHQIGSGRGNDWATALGAIGGAAGGATIAGRRYSQDVKRCENVASSGPPQYWDVSYRFRGRDYRAQLAYAPGPTITVNGKGEPRV